jgi:hypothetical protein
VTESFLIAQAVDDVLHPAGSTGEADSTVAERESAPIEPTPNALPPGFVKHAYEKRFDLAAPGDRVWAWLERPETFTEGQVWPYRVEFVSADPGVAPGFVEGGLNIHHGPLLNLPGLLTEIREGEYRDLHYLYGSYVGSLRLVRPTRLEFWVDELGAEHARVRLRLSSFVHRRLARPWTWAQAIFWSRFPRWMRRELASGG